MRAVDNFLSRQVSSEWTQGQLQLEKPFRETENNDKSTAGAAAQSCQPKAGCDRGSSAGPLGPTSDLGCPCRYREPAVTIICCVQVSRRLWWPVWTNKLGRLQTRHCVLAAVVLHSYWRPVAWTPAPQGRHNFKWPQTLLPFSLETHTASSMLFLDCGGLQPLSATVILTRK